MQLQPRGFNVTWRVSRPVARPGLLLVGDAAARLDPAAGQGVFFALESGLRASKVVAACLYSPRLASFFLARYDSWVMDEFTRKVRGLANLYRDLGINVTLPVLEFLTA
jgi:flavin-dependent dehydrogenase